MLKQSRTWSQTHVKQVNDNKKSFELIQGPLVLRYLLRMALLDKSQSLIHGGGIPKRSGSHKEFQLSTWHMISMGRQLECSRDASDGYLSDQRASFPRYPLNGSTDPPKTSCGYHRFRVRIFFWEIVLFSLYGIH